MDNPAVSIKKYGSRAALPIFAKSIKKIYDFGEYSLGSTNRELNKTMDWKKPSRGIVTKKICKQSMKIANKYCKNKSEVKDEFFLDNYIPYDKCNIKSHLSRYK
jgi:penicillin-binding protein 1A